MTKRARRNHTSAFKAKLALAAIKGEKTRWPNWRSNSMSIRTRSRSGAVSFSTGRPGSLGATRMRRPRLWLI